MEFPRGSFERVVEVAPADCGRGGALSPSAALLAMQDVATASCDRIGLTHDALLQRYGVVFMAAAQAVRFARPLRAGETLRVRTDPIAARGPYFLRQTVFFDETGAAAAEGQAAWAIIDAKTGAPQRSTLLRDQFDLLPGARPFCDAARLRFPAAETGREAYAVTAADADLNGHMNNTVYADLLMRCMPEIADVAEFAIRYRRQCFPGDVLRLCRDGELAAGYLGEELCFSGYCRTR